VLQFLENDTLTFEPFQQLNPASRALCRSESALRVGVEPQLLDGDQLPGSQIGGLQMVPMPPWSSASFTR
jgi:hypothetical protein